jgi:adenine/guanine/hypoxanthine permease
MLTKLFGFDPAKMTVRKEIVAGITTFLTMAYILAVNPDILSAAGMDKGAVFTTTAVASAIATFVMAFHAKLPFALAPAMGLNAFFAFTVCLTMGYSWQFALTAVFIEGIIFILLTLTGLRNLIVESMPLCLRRAIAPGIGLFIAFIGLKSSGIIVSNESTFVSLGDLHTPAVLLAVFGIILTSVLLIRKVMGALLIGILVTAAIGIPLGVTNFTGVFDMPPSIEPIVWKMDWSNVFSLDMAVCVFTFLFVDMFDTIGTIVGVSSRAGMVDKDGKIQNLSQAFMADAIGTTVGAALGTSTISTYVESAAGVNAGGRSGLTAFVVGVCLVLSLFFAPLFLAIPSQATASALFLVGVMMVADMGKIDFTKYAEAIPCFVTIIMMPLAYSIADGILLGVIAYVILYLLAGKVKELSISTVVLAVLFIARYALL